MYDNLIKTFTQFNIIVERGGGYKAEVSKKRRKLLT